jgi:NAD(P)-dependent dehydrogenase (short-subunit alcohol dehydrogenase family)
MHGKSVAIVTGASQGIGRATARYAWHAISKLLVLAARQEGELAKTAAAVKSAGAEPLTYALDLYEPCSVEKLVQGTVDRFGRIDALLNIAGAVPQIHLFEMTDARGKMAWLLSSTVRAGSARRGDDGPPPIFPQSLGAEALVTHHLKVTVNTVTTAWAVQS